MLFVDVVGSAMQSVAGTFGLVCNITLIYLLLFDSPKEMKTYSYLLLNMAVSDAITCMCALFVEPRIIPHFEDVIYVANGLCNFLGSKAACWLGYESLLCFFVHQNWSLLGSFIYRLYVLYVPHPKRTHVFILIFIISLPTVFGEYLMIPYALEMLSIPAEPTLLSLYPDIDIQSKIVFIAHKATTDHRPLIISIMVLAFIFPFTVIVVVIRWIILRKLKRTNLLSKSAKHMHKSLLSALTLQAALPSFYMIGSAIFTFEWMTGVLMPPVEYLVPIFLGSIAAINPVFSLYFVYHFRIKLSNLISNKIGITLKTLTNRSTITTSFPSNGSANGSAVAV